MVVVGRIPFFELLFSSAYCLIRKYLRAFLGAVASLHSARYNPYVISRVSQRAKIRKLCCPVDPKM